MSSYYSTRQVALLLKVTPARLTKALWDGRIDPPKKAPNGAFLWTSKDIDRASWQLLKRAYEPQKGGQ